MVNKKKTFFTAIFFALLISLLINNLYSKDKIYISDKDILKHIYLSEEEYRKQYTNRFKQEDYYLYTDEASEDTRKTHYALFLGPKKKGPVMGIVFPPHVSNNSYNDTTSSFFDSLGKEQQHNVLYFFRPEFEFENKIKDIRNGLDFKRVQEIFPNGVIRTVVVEADHDLLYIVKTKNYYIAFRIEHSYGLSYKRPDILNRKIQAVYFFDEDIGVLEE